MVFRSSLIIYSEALQSTYKDVPFVAQYQKKPLFVIQILFGKKKAFAEMFRITYKNNFFVIFSEIILCNPIFHRING